MFKADGPLLAGEDMHKDLALPPLPAWRYLDPVKESKGAPKAKSSGRMQVFSMSGDIVDSELQKAGFEVDVRVVKKSDEGVVVHRIHDLTDKSKVILHVVPIEKQNKRAKPEDVVVTRLELMENWKVFVSNEVKVIGMWSFACMSEKNSIKI